MNKPVTYDKIQELPPSGRKVGGVEIVRREGPVPHSHVDNIIVRRFAGESTARTIAVAEFVIRALSAAEARGDGPVEAKGDAP